MKNNYIYTRRFLQAFLILILSAGFFQLKAQDPIFSQFYNNPIYYNPGYIGLNSGIRTRFNYRNQWTGIPDPFKTYSFSMDMAERAIPGSGGIGILATSDKAGTASIKATNIGIGTSARIPLYDNMVAQVGFMVSYAQKALNWDELVFTDELNARYGRIYETQFDRPESNRVSYPDFSVGGVYRFAETGLNNSNIQGTLGLAFHHVF
jgi:type IX secretion system PorP/SprF family membrane protein